MLSVLRLLADRLSFDSVMFKEFHMYRCFVCIFFSENVAESKFALFLETDDIEAAVSKAVGAGAVAESEIAEGDGPYVGSRVSKLKDPFGFTWIITSPDEEINVVEP